jgi:protease-4
MIYQKVKEAQENGIKVVVLMRGVAASGGYYIAAPADYIVANQLTITGSIGVVWQFQSLDGLYDKLGIEMRTITNSEGDYKTGEGLFDEDPVGEEDQIIQEIVDETFNQFIEIIVEGRGLDRNKVLEIADGRILTGQQALDKALVDELGDFTVAKERAEELSGITDATVIEYIEYDFWSMFASYFTSVVNPTASVANTLDIKPGPRLMYLYQE